MQRSGSPSPSDEGTASPGAGAGAGANSPGGQNTNSNSLKTVNKAGTMSMGLDDSMTSASPYTRGGGSDEGISP